MPKNWATDYANRARKSVAFFLTGERKPQLKLKVEPQSQLDHAAVTAEQQLLKIHVCCSVVICVICDLEAIKC